MSGADPGHVHGLTPWLRWQPHVDNSRSVPVLKENEDTLLIILVALLTITIFPVLFVFRSWDDNRLTSWQWVFADIGVFYILFILFIGVFLAYGLSRISAPANKFITRPTTWLFLLSLFVSAMFWGEPEVIVDTSRYFIQAKYLELYGIGYFFREWGNEIPVWTDLPLVPLLYGLVFKFFGEYRIAIQIFNSLLFSGTVVLTCLVGKTLWNKTIGLYGGILLLGIPYLLTQVPLMLVDVATMFFFTLALFTTVKAVKQGGIVLLVLASVTIVLAMLSKYSVWLMFSVIPFVLLSYTDYGWKVILHRAAVIVLTVAVLAGMALLWKYNVFAEQLTLIQSYQVPGLKRWGESFTSTFFFQTHPYITLAALFSVYVALKNKDFKYVIIGWLLLLVFVLEIRRARYLIVIFPMLALMAAYGMNEIRNVRITRFIVSSTVTSALVVAMFAYLPFLQNTSAVNMSQAGKYLDSLTTQNADTIEVLALPQVRSMVNPAVSVAILDLFTQKTLVYRYDENLVKRPQSVELSSLRFTWEYKNPGFLQANSGSMEPLKKRMPLAIILGYARQDIPTQIAERLAGYRLVKELMISDKVFKYQTMIRVYLPV